MTDPIEAVQTILTAEYNYSLGPKIISDVIAAYTKAVGSEAVAEQRRFKLPDGNWSEWYVVVPLLEVLFDKHPFEIRPLFAAPPVPAGYKLGPIDRKDTRPVSCRHRLQDEGKAYPRSSCAACGATITTGLGRYCQFEAAPENTNV